MSKTLEELFTKLFDSDRHCMVDWIANGGVDVTLDFRSEEGQTRNVAHPRDIAAAIEEMIGDE